MTIQSLLMGCKAVSTSFTSKILPVVCLMIVCQTGVAGDKTIDGGAGTNAAQINIGIDLDAFSAISYDGSETYTFTVSGSDLSIKNIDSLSVNSVAWTNLVGNGNTRSDTSNMCAGYSRNDGVFSAPAANKVVLFDWDSTSSSNITNLCMDTSTLGSSFSQNSGHYAATVYGASINDIVMVDNGWVSTITMGDGDDVVHAKDSDAPDDIDMGAGDDFLIIDSDANDTSLDGGSGSDWLAFRTVNWGASSAKTYTLNSGNASNFENLLGSDNDDTLTGDANANIIIGAKGVDTINGGAGNDTIWGDCSTSACKTLISQNQSSYSLDESYWGSSGKNDILNGGAGDDTIYGEIGDDTIDGGAGNDTIISGSGSDVIIITSSSDSDTLSDFTDGTDAIGFDSSITSSNLVIAASGSDTVIKNGSDILLTLTGISSANVTAADLQSTSTDAQTINGTSGNDILVGGAGNDTFNGGAGSDQLVGWGGDDTFNITSKSGSWTDTINGGSGTDILNVSYSINLEAFASLSYDNSSTYTFVDSSGGTINFDSIETLNVNSIAWTNLVGNGNTRSDTSNMCAGYSRNDG
uniref:calcium-binding protein n=1 Tax=Flavobacterium sp. TaxID=239 RepID=UPI0040483E47